MPNIKSAAKRDKTSLGRAVRNKGVKTNVATLRKRFLDAISQGDKDLSDKTYREYVSGVDKALKKGVIKAGTANRRKSRAQAKLIAL
jgi:small subunit ribosomal protein S20